MQPHEIARTKIINDLNLNLTLQEIALLEIKGESIMKRTHPTREIMEKRNNVLMCITICIITVLLFTSCAHLDTTVCRHNAVNAAILHKSENPKDEVVICSGSSNNSKNFHAQAKYRKPGGEWIFLQMPASFSNWDGIQDNFTIEYEFSIKTWLLSLGAI